MSQGISKKSQVARGFPSPRRELHRRHSQDHRWQTASLRTAGGMDRRPQIWHARAAEGPQFQRKSLRLCEETHSSVFQVGSALWFLHHKREHGVFKYQRRDLCVDQPGYPRKQGQNIPAGKQRGRSSNDTQHNHLPEALAEIRPSLPGNCQQFGLSARQILSSEEQGTVKN